MIGEDDRLKRANELIGVIASCGRRFFRKGDRVANLEVDSHGRVWFVDAYKGTRVFTHYKGGWRNFSGGGTLKRLIERLRDFVKQDRPLPQTELGPWPEWVCGGDLWGYGDQMQQVRSAAIRLSIIA